MSSEQETVCNNLRRAKWPGKRFWAIIWPNAPGGRCARIIARPGKPGCSFRTITPARKFTAGNEDGLAGLCDDKQHMCFALALWNGHDPILKERLFGLAGPEGNHGEDVKEYYFYLDSTPTHSYMKMLYKYPQAAFPYAQLVAENARRGRQDNEYELLDTGVFNDNRYFDVFVEYAKAGPEDILIQITAHNRGPESAPLHILPTLWFRNTWDWGRDYQRPSLGASLEGSSNEQTDLHSFRSIRAQHPILGEYFFYCQDATDLLFTENETNTQRLYGVPASSHWVKDGINDYVVNGQTGAVNPMHTGTKGAAHYSFEIKPGGRATVRLRLTGLAAHRPDPNWSPFGDFEQVFDDRVREADDFYAALQPTDLSEDERRVQRQAFAGMLWSKQFYHYVVEQWLEGDPTQPPPPPRTLPRSQLGLAAPLQRTRDVHARQVGVSLVCRLGFSLSTASRWLWWTASLPKVSSISCSASGINTPTGQFQLTNGPLAT